MRGQHTIDVLPNETANCASIYALNSQHRPLLLHTFLPVERPSEEDKGIPIELLVCAHR